MPLTNRFDFSALSGKAINVAIVDSGIDSTHPRIGTVVGGIDLRLDAPAGGGLVGADFSDRAGHGTACAGIIRDKAPEANLHSIRIFDESLSADGGRLIAALRWAIDHQMDVVNLSLGTRDVSCRDELRELCLEAAEAGVILVAAAHNDGGESYPAMLPEVIGVKGGVMRGRYRYLFRDREPIECVARGDEQRLCWPQPRQVMTGGTSFAAPHITGLVTLIREAVPRAGLDVVRRILRENAAGISRTEVREHDKRSRGHFSQRQRDRDDEDPTRWINKAALYPFNKEMHSFVRYDQHLEFEISGVADPAGKGFVGMDAGEAIGLAPRNLRIVPRLTRALDGADTLILGYVDELARVARRDVLRESVEAALTRGLNVFSFLPLPHSAYGDLHSRARAQRLVLHSPTVASSQVRDLLSHPPSCEAVDVPVLGVIGTSSSQGKFTVQLALRHRLLGLGYRVGQIGTEHHSQLFGMDFAFPMGYASPLDLPLQYYAPFLDLKMRELCHRRQPDIVIVGAQSGTIPYDVADQATHTLPTVAFLLGTRPDATILVVNSIDADNYIEDTIDSVHGFARSKTILLAMSDKEKQIRTAYGRSFITARQLTGEQIGEKLRYLEDRFELPAVDIISDEGQQKMVETVASHFASEERKHQ